VVVVDYDLISVSLDVLLTKWKEGYFINVNFSYAFSSDTILNTFPANRRYFEYTVTADDVLDFACKGLKLGNHSARNSI
jgi:hypothetical protein